MVIGHLVLSTRPDRSHILEPVSFPLLSLSTDPPPKYWGQLERRDIKGGARAPLLGNRDGPASPLNQSSASTASVGTSGTA